MSIFKKLINTIGILLIAATCYGQGGGYSQPAVWGRIVGDPTAQADMTNLINQQSSIIASNSTGNLSNELASTALGNEGIRRIGALGGYTLEGYLEDTGLRGPARDMPVFTYTPAPGADLTVSWTGGDIYSPVDGYFHLISGTTELVDESNNYAYWNASTPTQVKFTTTRPAASNNIVLATFVTAFGRVIGYDPPEAIGDFPINTRAGAARIAPSLIIDGLQYSAVATNLNAIVMSAGTEYHDMRVPKIHNTQDLRNPTQTVAMITYFHTNTGLWGYTYTNLFPVGFWDNGTNLVACDTNSWYAGLFLSLPDAPQIDYVYPQQAYTSEVDAIAGNDPSLPPGFSPYVPICTKYVFKGEDTSLRTDGTYWVDRRFQIRRPGGVASGSSSTTPSLDLVMLSGSSLGGILPRNAGLPTTPDQLASKAYVDSTINNVNAHRAYVDPKGSNLIAQLESSILPFKTIQAAINAASAVANSTTKYSIVVSSGTYNENISMSNNISIVGNDIEGTHINGTITFPPQYTDTIGSEISLVSVYSTNTPALTFNAGDDDAYMGARSCAFYTTYDNGQSNKSVVLINRGLDELYATCYVSLNLAPTNGSGAIRNAQLFEHTTDPANPGLSQFTAFNVSGNISSTDTNDDISIIFTHDNTDAECINTLLGSMVNVYLNGDGVYTNSYKQTNHKTAQGRSLSMGTVTWLYLGYTNNVNVFFGYASGGTTDNVAIVRGNHIRMPEGSTSNIWLGAAVGTSDRLRVYDSVYIQNYSDFPYPKVYTNDGAAGKFFVNTVTENGDQLFGSAIDISTVNSTTVATPAIGHLKLYASPYAGIEDLYLKDSSGNLVRGFRDNFYRGYNDTATPMVPGEAVYISSGLSADSTPKVKRSIASDPATMPAIGLVVHNGGIATGGVGRIMFFGRTETSFDTSAFTSGDKLYVSATVAGGITNVAPTGNNIVQQIGTCHKSATNGYVNVRPWAMDTLGGLTPNKFVTNGQSAVSFGAITGDGTAVSNVNAATLGNYTYEQLISQQLTYYIWGSLVGPFTNGIPVSRMAQLSSPAGLPVRTNLYLSVTNGQILGGVSINTNENPRATTVGISTIHNVLSYTGGGVGRARGTLYIYEADQTTVVASYIGEIIPLDGGAIPTPYSFDISVTNEVSISDHGRIMLFRTILVDGWTGTETVAAYSQNGYLSRVTLSAANTGVYVSYYQYTIDKIAWDIASVVASNNSLRLSAIEPRTNLWNQAVLDGTNWITHIARLITSTDTSRWNQASLDGTNWQTSVAKLIVAADTSRWNTASTVASNNSLRLSAIEPRTNLWNQAVADGSNWNTSVAYLISSTSTSNWNKATNDTTSMNTRTSLWNQAVSDGSNWITHIARLINSTDTSRWNSAYTTSLIASNIANTASNKAFEIGDNTNKYQIAYDHSIYVAPRFKAGIATNIVLTTGTRQIPFTNLLYNVGGTYSNATARWYPGVTNKILEFMGGIHFTIAQNNAVYSLNLYKNGTNYSTLYSYRPTSTADPFNLTWNFLETENTSTTDFYEVYVVLAGNGTSTGTYSNNWWSGVAE